MHKQIKFSNESLKVYCSSASLAIEWSLQPPVFLWIELFIVISNFFSFSLWSTLILCSTFRRWQLNNNRRQKCYNHFDVWSCDWYERYIWSHSTTCSYCRYVTRTRQFWFLAWVICCSHVHTLSYIWISVQQNNTRRLSDSMQKYSNTIENREFCLLRLHLACAVNAATELRYFRVESRERELSLFVYRSK